MEMGQIDTFLPILDIFHETHISTFEPETRPPPWFPIAHGHQGRAGNSQKTPPKRPDQVDACLR
jgi:hypothetical protein